MKKLSFILLMAALALPMMAQTKAEEDAAMANYRHKAVPSFTLQSKKAPVAVLRDEIPNGYASVTLSAADVWGDGTGYQMLLDADATAYGNIFPVSGAFALEDWIPFWNAPYGAFLGAWHVCRRGWARTDIRQL